MSDRTFSTPVIASSAFGLLVVLVLVVGVPMYGCPVYNVWQKHKEGEAELAQAEANRQILVQTAQAKEESAKFEAQAEVERAKGVAQANQIIGDSLKDNPDYLVYLWVKGLQDGNNEVIYVATESGVPITEAGRLNSARHIQARAQSSHPVEADIQGAHVHVDRQSASQVKE